MVDIHFYREKCWRVNPTPGGAFPMGQLRHRLHAGRPKSMANDQEAQRNSRVICYMAPLHRISLVLATPLPTPSSPRSPRSIRHGQYGLAFNLAGTPVSPLARLDTAAQDEDLDAELRRRITTLRTTAARFIDWPTGLEMAFVCEGVIHCWNAEAAWYLDFQAQVAAALPSGADEFDEPLSDKDGEAVVERLAQELVALPDFRAAGSEGSWRRVARAYLASPDCDPSPLEELPDHMFYAVTRRAADQAMAETHRRYAGAEQRIPELAQQIAADPLYRTARTAPARKHRARDYLMTQADGYSPPTRVLDLLLDALATGRTGMPDPGPMLPFTSD